MDEIVNVDGLEIRVIHETDPKKAREQIEKANRRYAVRDVIDNLFIALAFICLLVIVFGTPILLAMYHW